MKKYFFTSFKNKIISSLLITTFCVFSLQAVQSPKEKIKDLIKSFPYMGLAVKETTYGPITLKKLDFGGCGRIVCATPGEIINGSVKYKVDADKMETLHLHHIIIGIKGQDHQDCITHSLGVWNSKGTANFSLVAPSKRGIYEVRFDHEQAFLCQDAISAWQKDNPSSSATVGFIIVE